MAMITDKNGNFPYTDKELRYLIEHSDFFVAWLLVMTHIIKADIQPFHKRMMRWQLEHKDSLIMAARGIGKSYTLTTGYSITHILRNREITIAVITAGKVQSEAFVNEIRQYFEEGSVIWEVYGDLKGDRWNTQEITVKRKGIIKEATVTAGSMTSSSVLISKHFQLIILDDIVSIENSATKGQREKLKNFMNNTVFPLLELQYEGAAIKAIGTYYHFDDYWHRLEESERFKDSILKVGALRRDKKKELQSIWEWKLPLNRLMQYKTDLGRTAFNFQYLMKSPKGDGGIFKRKWVNYFNKFIITEDGVYVPRLEERDNNGATEYIEKNYKLKLFMGVDLAIGQGKDNDRTVISVIGIDDYGNIYLLYMSAKRLTFRQTVNEIRRIYNLFPGIVRVGIESVAYQQAMAQEAQEAIPGIPVLKIKTSKDKETRFEVFSGQFELGKVFLYSHLEVLDLLEEEMFEFGTAKHDDTIDSFTIAYETYKRANSNTEDIDWEAVNRMFL